MFRDELGEGDEQGDLERHLSVVLHTITEKISITKYLKHTVAYRNWSDQPVAMNSIQFSPKAMIFEATIVTTMNLIVSTAPHSLSKYLRDAGTKIMVAIN